MENEYNKPINNYKNYDSDFKGSVVENLNYEIIQQKCFQNK